MKRNTKTKILAVLTAATLLLFNSCGGGNTPGGGEKEDEVITLKLMTFTDEVTNIIQYYIDTHPDCGFEMDSTYLSDAAGQYQPELDKRLKNNEVDLYATEAAFFYKYAKGEMADYAMPLSELGITDKKVSDAQIAPYLLELGSNKSGQLTGASYNSCSNCFIYKRDVAKAVFNTDDPEEIKTIIGGGSKNLIAFTAAAASLADEDYVIVPGLDDLWKMWSQSAEKGWIDEDGKLYIDPYRDDFFNIAKNFKTKGYVKSVSGMWTENWFNDMKTTTNTGDTSTNLGFIGPEWFLNLTIANNCNGVEYAVCEAPYPSWWSGVFVHVADKEMSNSKKEIIRKLIEWFFLDTTENGFQSLEANGTYPQGSVNSVPSKIVMDNSNYQAYYCKNQKIQKVFANADAASTGIGNLFTEKEDAINNLFFTEVKNYVNDTKTKDAAIASFKTEVAKLGIEVE